MLATIHMPRRFQDGLAALLGAVLLLSLAAGARAEALYTFGIVPQQSASKLARTWGPLLSHLSEKSGVTLRFQTAKNIPEFEKQLAQGGYHFAYMNPYHFTVFNKQPGYRALAREADKKIQGIVVVRKDDPVTSIKALAGQTMAFPAPAAFAASVLPRAHFRQAGIAITPKYVSSHDSVYRAVAKGLMQAGGGINRTFQKADESVRRELRILWRTQRFTPHAIAVHPKVSETHTGKIRTALVQLSETESGRALLKNIGFRKLEPATDKDWDDIRALGIDLLTSLIAGK